MNYLLYLAAFAAGVTASLGLGGGMVLILYLTIVLHMEQEYAQGINLLFFLPIAFLALILHGKHGLIRWSIVLPTVTTGLISAGIGAWLANRVSSVWLSKGFSVFLLVVGIRELWLTKKSALPHCEENPDSFPESS